jgi:chromosome segregation ATPase
MSGHSSRKTKSRSSNRAEGEVAELRRALEDARARLTAAEAAHRATQQENLGLRGENEMLEEQLTQLVREIGHLKFLTERSDLLEREAKLRDEKIAELSADVERLRATLATGRPTALAAATAAARAAQASLFERR